MGTTVAVCVVWPEGDMLPPTGVPVAWLVDIGLPMPVAPTAVIEVAPVLLEV